MDDPRPDGASRDRWRVRALQLAERIDLRRLDAARRVAHAPLTLRAGRAGWAVVFRWGAVVLVGLDEAEERRFLASLDDLLERPHARREDEETEIVVDPSGPERVDADGTIRLRSLDVPRVQVVAEALGRSVLLGHFEANLAAAFERLEPIAEGLGRRRWRRPGTRRLLREIGDVLRVQQELVGRAEVEDKPEITWDDAALDRLYVRLEDEFEIGDRARALDRKLELIYRTLETYLGILQDDRSLRVEWYIVLLIGVEILLTLYEMFRPG
ncbi:MAG: hypothetical protein Kow0062_11780 [Acidobacteriota bacterium]